MATAIKLFPSERELFGKVSRAAFSNPFGAERERLDREISGAPEGATRLERIALIFERLRRTIEPMEAEGRARLGKYGGEDQQLLRNAFLFEIYCRYTERFNRLIEEQIKTGDTPCRVSFADEAMRLFLQRGFSPTAARSYFAMFFQVRRGYYFIESSLIGCSPCMINLRSRLWSNVFTHNVQLYEQHLWNRMEDFSTLLLGETGTGKGAAAAAIGRSGFIPFDDKKKAFARSFTQTFTAINLSQFPETLIESELFGHRKGSFTGAVDNHEGVLARCPPHGSTFLDEIGDVEEHIQIKLLQVLQSRTFSPVGSHDPQRFHGRVIAATNQPLDDLRRTGRFRNDFFYRLCSDVITVPPLRQRFQEDDCERKELIGHIV